MREGGYARSTHRGESLWGANTPDCGVVLRPRNEHQKQDWKLHAKQSIGYGRGGSSWLAIWHPAHSLCFNLGRAVPHGHQRIAFFARDLPLGPLPKGLPVFA
jgi:hypothetical protein